MLELDGYDVISVRDGTELLEEIASSHLGERKKAPIDLIIADIRMPGFSGLQVLEGIQSTEWKVPTILITGYGDQKTRQRAKELGVAAFFEKPFDTDDLRTAVLNLLPESAEVNRLTAKAPSPAHRPAALSKPGNHV